LPPAAQRAHEAYRVFAVATRLVLRRRLWRWFDRLGQEHPERYVMAAQALLRVYSDEDTRDELVFLDNWGLLHLLFRHSDALRRARGGWGWAEPSRAWRELMPAPAHEAPWQARPDVLLDLMSAAPCRVVRTWAARLLRRLPPEALKRLPVEAF